MAQRLSALQIQLNPKKPYQPPPSLSRQAKNLICIYGVFLSLFCFTHPSYSARHLEPWED